MGTGKTRSISMGFRPAHLIPSVFIRFHLWLDSFAPIQRHPEFSCREKSRIESWAWTPARNASSKRKSRIRSLDRAQIGEPARESRKQSSTSLSKAGTSLCATFSHRCAPPAAASGRRCARCSAVPSPSFQERRCRTSTASGLGFLESGLPPVAPGRKAPRRSLSYRGHHPSPRRFTLAGAKGGGGEGS